jgi:hypothetical protein
MAPPLYQDNFKRTPTADVALAITRKKALYGRWADTKQWHRYREITLPDATFRFFNQDGSFVSLGGKNADLTSPDSFGLFFGPFFATKESLHNLGLGDFELVAPGEVRAVWALEDQVVWKWVPLGLCWLRGGGHYYETWVEKDGEWWMTSLDMHRTYTKMSMLCFLFFILDGVFPFLKLL